MATETIEAQARREVEQAAPPAETPEAVKAQELFVERRVEEIEEAKTPTKPDIPGGQTAKVNGKVRFISGSTMYEKGFRTPEEQIKAQQIGATSGLHKGKLVPKDSVIVTTKAGKPYARYTPKQLQRLDIPYISEKRYLIPVEDFTGKKIYLTGTQVTKLSSEKGKDQFNLAIKYGIIPRDSQYVQAEEGKWSYIPAFESGIEARAKALELRVAKRDFETIHTMLPDDNWMLNTDLAIIKDKFPEQYRILTIKGYDSYSAEIGKAEAALSKYPYLITVYKDGKPRIKKTESYNTIKAVKAGLGDEVRLLFGQEALNEANRYISVEKEYDKYGDLNIAVLSGMAYGKLDLLFDKKDINKAIVNTKSFKETLKETSDYVNKARTETLTAKDIFGAVVAEYKLAIHGMPYSTAEVEMKYLPKAREKITATLKDLPLAIKVPAAIAARVTIGGLFMAPMYTAGFTAAVAGIPLAQNKAQYTKQIGTSIVTYFTGIPARVVKDPLEAAEIFGIFVLGPVGTFKLARGMVAKASPFYIPSQGMRFSFTTGKVSTTVGQIGKAIREGKITEADVARAVGRAIDRALKDPKATGKSRIGKSNVYITVDPTPVSKRLGGILWHAAPSKEAYKGLEFIVETKGVEPALFTSPHAAPRFALQAAHGEAATSPCLVMIYTKKGGLQWYPSSIEYARTLAQLRTKGFEYLGSGRAKPGAYHPIKTYLNRFENEALLPNGVTLYRVRNLKSRILGASAGEFVTTADGWVMPIFRFAEKGANVPTASLARLAAIRVESVYQGLKSLLGKKGFKAKYESVEKLTSEFEAIGKKASEGKMGKAAETASTKAIDNAMARRLRRIYDSDRVTLERAWKTNPEPYEIAYRERLSRNIARAYGVRAPRYRTPSRYITLTRSPRIERDITRRRIDRIRENYRTMSSPRYTPYSPRERYEPYTPRVTREVYEPYNPRQPYEPREPYKPYKPVPRIPGVPPPPIITIPRKRKKKDEKKKLARLAVPLAWRQGFVWWVIYPPYKSKADVKVLKKPPEGARIVKGIGSAYKTIQGLGGNVNILLTLDMGAFDVTITRPKRAGAKGTIKFTRDVKSKTRSDIDLAGVRV